jgi:pilus assembly protein CpaE
VVNRRIVLGCADPELSERVRSVAAELDDNLVRVATTSADVLDAVAADDPDVLIVSDTLGPVPVLDLIRQAARQDPFTGILLLSSSSDPELFRVAMEAGARSVAPVSFTVDDLGQRIDNAANWASLVRTHVANEASRSYGTGQLLVLAGAKGGVGTTTLAVHLAVQAAQANRRVCLIDFDLLTGDVAALLDISHRRDVVDLVAVAAEVSGQALDDALYRHPSGVHVLLAPREGERGEEVTEGIGRAVLGAVKSRFDLVVVDVGSVLTPAGAAAVEIADRVALVTTPDVLAARGARRTVALWERLQLRRENEVTVVLNKVSRSVEVQPDLAGRLVRMPIAEAGVPASFRAFEAATNTGDPSRLVDRDARRALARLAEHLGGRVGANGGGEANATPGAGGAAAADLADRAPRSRRRSRRAAAEHRSGGQTSVELLGMTPIILGTLMLLTQGALIGYSHILAGDAASAAARVAVSPEAGFDDIAARARTELPDAWQSQLKVTVDGMDSFVPGDPRPANPDSEITVVVRTPAVIPFLSGLLGDGLLASSTAQMRFEGKG